MNSPFTIHQRLISLFFSLKLTLLWPLRRAVSSFFIVFLFISLIVLPVQGENLEKNQETAYPNQSNVRAGFQNNNLILAQARNQKKAPENDKTFRAKIVIFPFVNLSKSPNYAYLSRSIASSLGTSIAMLKRFEEVDETAAEAAAKKLGFASLENLHKGQTLKIAQVLGADIYIVGSYLAIKEQIQIFGQIHNGKSGNNMGGSKEMGKLDSSLFTSLDKFAEGLTASLDKVVPRGKIVTVEKVVEVKTANFEFGFAPLAMMNLGYIKKEFPLGYGGALHLGLRDLFIKKTFFGIRAGYSQFQAKAEPFQTMRLIPVYGQLGYELGLGQSFGLLLFASAGMHIGEMSVEGDKQAYLLFAYGGGLSLRWNFSKRVYAGWEIFGHAEHGTKTNPYVGSLVQIGFRI